jgi:hypothetical protein
VSVGRLRFGLIMPKLNAVKPKTETQIESSPLPGLWWQKIKSEWQTKGEPAQASAFQREGNRTEKASNLSYFWLEMFNAVTAWI